MYKKTVIALTITTFVLIFAAHAIGIAWSIDSRKKDVEAEGYRVAMESNYRRAYYEFTYEISTANDALNKLLVSSDKTLQQTLLVKTSECCVKAVASAAAVMNASEENDGLAFINKAGDYASALNLKLSKGGEISEEDEDDLISVYVTLSAMERELRERADEINENAYAFLDNISASGNLSLIRKESDVAYPSLIYDGAFSDSLEESVPKGLGEKVVSEEEAALAAASYLPIEGEVEYVAKEEGEISSYIFQSEKNGNVYYVAVAEKGGLLVSLTSSIRANGKKRESAECEEAGKAYLNKIGLENMKAVWISDYDDVYYINYVYEQDGLIYYPDMIKIKISSTDMQIVGVECLNYLYNHTERETQTPTITRAQALEKASKIDVESIREAVVPTDGGKELLCYEICGTRGDDFYYVYVDALNGQQYKIMRVIDSENGKLIV